MQNSKMDPKVKVLIVGIGIIMLIVIITGYIEELQQKPIDTSSSTLLFPVQKRSGLGQMDALLEGKLELDNGYLRVKYFDDNYLLIWPHGFSLHIEGKEIHVIDSDGQLVARVGDQIKVGGGEAPAEKVEEYTGKSLPDNRTGPYWIVSEVIEPL